MLGRHRTALVVIAPLALAVWAGACGSSDNTGSNFGQDAGNGGDATTFDGPVFDGNDENLFGQNAVVSIAFDPPAATVTVDATGPKTASYSLVATFANGTKQSVPADALQFDRPDLASLAVGSPVVLTAPGPYAGVGTLNGVYQGKTATAKLTVQMKLTYIGPGVPPGAIGGLGGVNLPPDPSLSSLLYPYDKTYFPLGLTSPLVMWAAPNANDIYRVHLEQQNYSFDGYYAVAPPAQVRLDQATWDHLTASNGGDPLKIALSRWDTATSKAYASANESWTVVPASLRGAIYYWTTSAGGHMSRIRPGTGAIPEVLNPGIGGTTTCMGCHAVSADGSTLVSAVEGGGATDSSDNRPWVSYDLPSMTVRDQSHHFGANVAVNPNGKYTVFSWQPLKLADTATGTEVTPCGLETVPLSAGMAGLAHPVFSPDNKHFAAVQSNNTWHIWTNGTLVLMDWSETNKAFTNPRNLAGGSTFPTGVQAVAYPTFTPDSAWLAFGVADYAGGCHDSCADDAKDIGAIWLQSTAGAVPPAPVRLGTLTDSSPQVADRNVTFEPTFNPIERGGYNWVVVTSERDWGNRITGVPNNGKKRLWVGAVDKTPGATDPSHPGFFLEGQEEATTNMRGFWALAACIPTQGGGACQAGFECCSGFCDKGVCVDKGTIACKPAGDVCTVDADCCNPSVVKCTGGSCVPTKPR